MVATIPGEMPFDRSERTQPPPASKFPAKVKLDGFLSTPVVMYQGIWASRKNIIDYVAYVASGVHPSREPGLPSKMDPKIEKMLDVLHRNSKVSATGFQLVMGVSIDARPEGFNYNDNEIDVVLYQLLSIIYIIANSHDTCRLEDEIRRDG